MIKASIFGIGRAFHALRIPLLVLALASPLAACNNPATDDLLNKIEAVSGYSITQSQVDSIRASYDASFLSLAANYRELPRCPAGTSFSVTNRCRDNDIVRQFRATDAKILGLFTSLQAQIAAGNTTGAAGAFTTLSAAIKAAIEVVQQYS